MTIFENKDLDIKLIGLYCMIKYLNDNEQKVTQTVLASMTSSGEKSIAANIKKLKEKGYLTIEKKNVNGIFRYNYKLLK